MKHTGPVVKIVALKSIEAKSECPIGSGCSVRIVPFQISCDTVPQINTGKVWVVTRVKGASIVFKLVGKDKRQGVTVGGRLGLGGAGSVWIYRPCAEVLEERYGVLYAIRV